MTFHQRCDVLTKHEDIWYWVREIIESKVREYLRLQVNFLLIACQ